MKQLQYRTMVYHKESWKHCFRDFFQQDSIVRRFLVIRKSFFDFQKASRPSFLPYFHALRHTYKVSKVGIFPSGDFCLLLVHLKLYAGLLSEFLSYRRPSFRMQNLKLDGEKKRFV